MITFIQWNINGFYRRSVDINRIIYNFQPQIVCLQETNLKDIHTAQKITLVILKTDLSPTGQAKV
jgi:exonuclease III